MNYLAHAFLSFGQPEILTGNLIADFVKGKKQFSFSTGIQAGIKLHRAIDTFTDKHAATRAARRYFIPACGRYCGAFMDVVYDHFLARDVHHFNQGSLKEFAQKTYDTIRPFEPAFPERFDKVYYYMERQDWLSGYYSKEGIFKSFRGLFYRAEFLQEHDADAAVSAFEQHYNQLQHYYSIFMPELEAFAKGWFGRSSKEFSPHDKN